MTRIYLSPPHLGTRERELLLEALESNWIAPLGPQVEAFEREMCERLGGGHAVALSSGTAGLHLSLVVLGIGPGDEVIVPTLTFAATANAVVYTGARPVFVDCTADAWTLSPDLVEEELDAARRTGRRIKAVIAVDLYGHCADYDLLEPLCARYGVTLIEDAAEALGARYGERPAGTFGAMGVFSFNGNKIITTSGGGMLVSRRAEWIERARHLATQAREPVMHYEHRDIGYNYRMSNLLAAIGRGQLSVLDDRVRARRRVNRLYRDRLGDLPGLRFLQEQPRSFSTFWLTCATVDAAAFGASRDDIIAALAAEEIEARPVWKPMHLQPVYRGARTVGGATAARLFHDGICLPSGSSLGDDDIARIADLVRRCHGA
ncbi:MAG: aminotransferase class I/II-fold pyridoxal phosphate-dependent enzyme [Deltaproteobacteria bacterium]|nr:MAG: aminotransferase class I/II-fold pyridoxal phosphate-dependent enzyme [Deltaproteobacteria bacterium]